MQRLGKMVIKRVSKGRACEIPLGGHQVRGIVHARYCLLQVMQKLRKHVLTGRPFFNIKFLNFCQRSTVPAEMSGFSVKFEILLGPR